MPSSLTRYPTLQKLVDYLAGLGADQHILEHVRKEWDLEVKPRRQGGADLYWLSPGPPGRFSSMVKAAESLGLQPPKRARAVASSYVIEETDSDEAQKQPPAVDMCDGVDRPRPKRQTRPPQRTCMDLPLRIPRQRSVPPPPSPPSHGCASFLPTPLYPAAPHPGSNTLDPYFGLKSCGFDQPIHEYPSSFAMQQQQPVAAPGPPPILSPPVLVELEPQDGCGAGGAAHGLTEGAIVDWVASFILHAKRNQVRLLDRSGLVLASQNALCMQYVVEGECLRIKPLLDEEPPEGWTSLPVATPADQLGTAFDSGPTYTGSAVTAMLSSKAEGDNGEDEWALLDLRVPGGKVVEVRQDGGLRLEDGCVLPACLSQPQQPVHVQLQPQQLGQQGPGVEMVLQTLEEVLEAKRHQALLAHRHQQQLAEELLAQRRQQELEQQREQQKEELKQHRQHMEELQRQRQELEQMQQALLLQQQQQQEGMDEMDQVMEMTMMQEEEQQQESSEPAHEQQQESDMPLDEEGQHLQQQLTQVPAKKRGGARVWGRKQEPQVLPDNPPARKTCNCKKSRCLKLYCECFAAGHYCDNCCCVQCLNTAASEPTRQEVMDAVLEKNPLAFQSKIKEEVVAPDEAASGDTMGKHRKGCTCRKSACLKKYCECFQAGVFCADSCRCSECKNYEGSEQHAAVRSGISLDSSKQPRTSAFGTSKGNSTEELQQQLLAIQQAQAQRQLQLQRQVELEHQLQQQQRQQRGTQGVWWDVAHFQKVLAGTPEPEAQPVAHPQEGQEQGAQKPLQTPQQQQQQEAGLSNEAHSDSLPCSAPRDVNEKHQVSTAPPAAVSGGEEQASGATVKSAASQQLLGVDGGGGGQEHTAGLQRGHKSDSVLLSNTRNPSVAPSVTTKEAHQQALQEGASVEAEEGLSWEEKLHRHYQSLAPEPAEEQVARPTVTTAAAPILPWQY